MPNFVLSRLPFEYDALEPYIDKTTMELHYTKFHNTYLRNFKEALGDTKPATFPLEEIIKHISLYSLDVRNNGGGHYNHSLFWATIKPNGGGFPTGRLAEAIISDFGTYQDFKAKFNKAAMSCFGSGWAWLIVNNGILYITSTPNQDNPLMDIAEERGNPILALDVWEHAYYLKYRNRRAEYIENWWNVVNWNEVSRRFAKFDSRDPFPVFKPE
jgi:superoxide dismutase, Fe-Mn family